MNINFLNIYLVFPRRNFYMFIECLMIEIRTKKRIRMFTGFYFYYSVDKNDTALIIFNKQLI